MLQPTQSTDNSLPLSVRLRNSRQSGRFGVNRVKDGHTINTLRATGGPPTTYMVRAQLAEATAPDGGSPSGRPGF